MDSVSQTITDAYREHAVELEGATTNTAVQMKNNKRLRICPAGVEIADELDGHLELTERKNKVPIRLVCELSELIFKERRTMAAYRNRH